MKLSSLLAALVGLPLLSCSGGVSVPGAPGILGPLPTPSASATPSAQLQSGHWGTSNFNMDVNDAGATVQFACAKGTINGPLSMDASGHFSASGTYTFTSGPIDSTNPRVALPAQYSGTLTDPQTLSIEVTYTDENGDSQSGGNYTAHLGQQGANTLLCAQSPG
ncbi:MAG: hypothetical protein ACXWP5_02095 [Bdellovibrionota bacterium]